MCALKPGLLFNCLSNLAEWYLIYIVKKKTISKEANWSSFSTWGFSVNSGDLLVAY